MFDNIYLAAWAATLPMMAYSLVRRKNDLLPGLVVLFLMLSIPVLMGLNRPNPENVALIIVVTP